MNKTKFFHFFLSGILFLSSAASCLDTYKNIAPAKGYDLNNPSHRYNLPDELVEISGVSPLNDSIIACVQDDLGIIYYYNLKNNTIADRIRFGENGDYEDLCLNNGYFYVLRSDGTVFRIDRDNNKNPSKRYRLPVECLDNEGFCYSAKERMFFLAGKSRNVYDENASNRYIFLFSLQHDTFTVTRKVIIRIKDIHANLSSAYAGDIQKISGCDFNPSAVAVHPITGELFVLSAKSKLLIILDSAKTVTYVRPLNGAIFHKPEGIAFHPNGDMLISSEGQKKGTLKGYILFFNYVKER
jgi:WD40 repeat protein